MIRASTTQRLSPTARHRLALSCAIVASLALVGCGSDDDDSSATTARPASSSAAPTSEAPASSDATAEFDLATYCDAEVALEGAGASLGDPDADPVAFANALVPLAAASVAAAPPELAGTFATKFAALQAVADGTGDFSALFPEGGDPIHAYDVANCNWNRVPVTLEDYHFVGLPETMPAGDYNFDVSNMGTELHVLVIVARKPGETRTFDELLMDPNAEEAVVTLVGAGAAPGETGYGVVRLEPGEYFALCPIPTGSTPGNEGTGAPHFTAGMTQLITVTA